MKTKNELRQARWKFVRLWGLFFLLLLIWGLACDGTGGDVRRPEPQKPKCEYRYDFSANPEGSFPSDWWAFGTDKVQPKVITRDGNKVLFFNFAANTGGDKLVIAATPDSRTNCSAASVQVKLKFDTNSDFAGLLFGYIGEGHHIRIVLNPFHDWLLIEEHRGDSVPVKVRKDLVIDPGIDYWLKVTANYPTKTLTVYLATDGVSFNQIAPATTFTQLDGKYGFTTFGPNHPGVVIDDFVVMGEGTAPVVVPPTPTPKKILTNELVISDGILFSEDQVWPREEIWADFTIKNTADFAVTLDSLLLAVRGLDEDKGFRQDFTAVSNITIGPGKTYTYHQTQKYGYDQLGRYRAFVMALVSANHVPEGQNRWYQLNPDPKTKGLVGEVTFTVREMTEVEKVGTARFQGPYGVVIKNGDAEWTNKQLDWLQELYSKLDMSTGVFRNLPSLGKIKRVRDLGKTIGAAYNLDHRWIRIADFAIPLIDIQLPPCFKIYTGNALFTGVTMHEFAHALQYADPEKGKAILWCDNPLVTDYAKVSDWQILPKTNDGKCGDSRFKGKLVDLPGANTRTADCIWCADQSVIEDMAEECRLYVTDPQAAKGDPGTKRRARYEFVRDRIFKGKEY